MVLVYSRNSEVFSLLQVHFVLSNLVQLQSAAGEALKIWRCTCAEKDYSIIIIIICGSVMGLGEILHVEN